MTNVSTFILVCWDIQHSTGSCFPRMPCHPTPVLRMPRILRHSIMDATASITRIFLLVSSFIACCGIYYSMLQHALLVFFACQDILLSMLRHTTLVFPSCCSIEFHMLWHTLSSFNLACFGPLLLLLISILDLSFTK